MVGEKPKITSAIAGLKIQNHLWLYKLWKLGFAQGFLFLNEPHVNIFI